LHQIIGNTPGRNYNRYISLGDNRTPSTILRVWRVSWGVIPVSIWCNF